MDANFFYYSIYDLYKDNHVRACVCAYVCAFVNFFFKKTSQKLFTGLIPNFIVVFLKNCSQNLIPSKTLVATATKWNFLSNSLKILVSGTAGPILK